MAISKCRKCLRPLLWVKSERGAAMPLDPEPHDDGNVLMTAKGAKVLGKEAKAMRLALAEAQGETLRFYHSHFTTCPFADDFRRKGE